MRLFKKFLLLFCVFAFLLSSLSSCTGILLLSTMLLQKQEPAAQIPAEQVPAGEKLAYTLTDADKQTFLADLGELETLLLETRSSDETAIVAANEKMEDAYYHIATQAELAYIYHCLNQADAEKSQAYLYARSMRSEVYDAYQAFCKKLDASDAPGKSVFFADWSKEDLEEMRGYSEEHTALTEANDRIEVEYRALSQTERTERAPELYLQIIQNNNRLAALYGYKNYADYAYEKVYLRDYTPADAKKIHGYVKSILLPVCQSSLAKFQAKYSELDAGERQIVRALLEGEYNGAWNLMSRYFSSFPSEAEKQMRSLFLSENHFLTNAQTADAGAFTAYLYEYEQPVCYFGPGYHDGFTVIHELGHYFSALSSDVDLQMDIAETQSQANEWLFTAYLQNAGVSRALAETILYYQLHSSLQTIVLASLIDEFEQSIYQNPPESAEEIDLRMKQICQRYGGVELVKKQFADPMRYWRNVVLESPCYYISYAFSMLVSMSFYELATSDYAAAQSAYIDLAALQLEDGTTYCQWLENQSMHTPFERSYYLIITDLAA